MTITYNITLEIDGQGSVEIGDALDGLMITSGSSDGWEQPTAANCQIGFIGHQPLLVLTKLPLGGWVAVSASK